LSFHVVAAPVRRQDPVRNYPTAISPWRLPVRKSRPQLPSRGSVSDENLCAAVVEASSLFFFFFLIVFSVKFPPWEGFPMFKGEVGFPKSDFSLSQRNLLQMSYLEAVLIMSFYFGIFLQTMGIDPS